MQNLVEYRDIPAKGEWQYVDSTDKTYIKLPNRQSMTEHGVRFSEFDGKIVNLIGVAR
jgi:hypothetical protein